MRWLRHKANFVVFDWCEQLSRHPMLEEISDEEARPEFYSKQKLMTNAPSKRGRKPLAISDSQPTEGDFAPTELDFSETKRFERKLETLSAGTKVGITK